MVNGFVSVPVKLSKCGKTVTFICKIQDRFIEPVPAGLKTSVGMLIAGILPIMSNGFILTMIVPN